MKKNNKKGFTLVELVIVVAVMAILVAIAIPTVGTVTTKATNAVADSNANTIESMIKLAAAEAAVDNDGNPVVDATLIIKALTDAKLGIDNDTFYYNSTTGAVTHAVPTGTGVSYITIKFTSGVVTCPTN